MFRILLIDDEPHHIDHLTKLILTSGLPFTVCGSASDGLSALELSETLHPDLIVSDIRMPMKNGLLMTEELKGNNSSIPVILISAHQDFEYARAGLRLGILDYLLKPVDEKQVQEVLKKAEKFLIDSRANLLRHTLFPSPHDDKKTNAEMNKTLAGLKPYRLAIYLPQTEGENLEKLYRKQGRPLPKEILELKPRLEGARLFLFTGCGSGDSAPLNQIGIKTGGLLLSCENPAYDSWEKLSGEMDDRLWESGLWGKSGIGLYSETTTLSEVENPLGSFEWELKASLASDLNRDFQRLLTALLENLSGQNISMAQLKEGIRCLDQILIKDFGIKNNVSDSQIRRILEKLNHDLVNLGFNPGRIAAALVEALTSAVPESVSHSYSILKVKEYMDQNYDQNIDTSSLADMTGVSVKTLKTLFLQEFGMSPSKYLIEIRMNVAKKLLATRKDLQIKEIANVTGYEDPLYFSRIFNKKVGINPTQYRGEN